MRLMKPWFVRGSLMLCLVAGCSQKSAESTDEDNDDASEDTMEDEPNAKVDAARPVRTDAAARVDAAIPPRNDAAADAVDAAPDAADEEPVAGDESSLLPWKTGHRWTYRVTGGGQVGMKTTTVGALEEVGGKGPNRTLRAFKVTTEKGAMDKTVSWQAVVGESVLRYREVAYSASTGAQELEEHWAPHKLHVHSDAQHRRAGEKWVETYEETKTLADGGVAQATVSDTWMVDGTDISVTVPAGTFKAVVLIKAGATSQKTYWYVPGVGKVKETGGQTEELVSYELAP